MESVINAALVEICTQGQDGLPLPALWPKLQQSLSSGNLDLSAGVKRAVWANLLRIPTLLFEAPKGSFCADDSSIQTFEDAEKLNLKIIAQESLRDSFFGLYNVQSANARLSNNQRSVLKLLADAREKGITQSQLSKKLGIKENNVFYVLKSLDCQGLIVKQSALERKKDTCLDGESKYYPCVTTNLVYLNRYAKQLGSHQRVEITKWEQNSENPEEANGNASRGETDVLVKDYTQQMKAISDKLEKANNKVLLVSDIKKDLGYRGSRSRQKAWREILRRLIADHTVEQFDAKVDGKVEACLRLLKPVTAAAENDDENFKYGKKVQVIDQLVELPPEQQIFDMIDAAGSDGIVLKEICERLGFDLKKAHPRLINMCHGFGMKAQDGQLNRTKAYRLWTSRNFNPEPEVKLICKPDKTKLLDHHASDSSGKILPEDDALAASGYLVDPGNMEDTETDAVPSCGSPENIESRNPGTPVNLQELVLDSRSTVSNNKHDLVRSAAQRDVPPSGALPPERPPSSGSYQRFPALTGDGNRRAIKIIERLEDEKIILRSEMPRWLASLEKDKPTTLDRKTVDRILNELQKQGLCKCIAISVPVITDCSKNRTQHVVMHPSMNLSPELVDEIQARVRHFDMESRKQGLSRKKDDETIPVMENIQKTRHTNTDERAGKAEAMRVNGFILAKMIRAKLLHSFLWDYLHSSVSHNGASSSELCVYEQSNPHSSSKFFSLEAAIKEIPIELFLQVVGSTKKYEEMIEKCKMGLRLSDLSPQEYKCLMDTHATGRLSLVVDILRRLKLIRMATDMQSRAEVEISHHSLTHMMELKPYIEEPISNYAASLNFKPIDLRPRIRHDFLLSSRDALDDYWRTLEYCYAAADPTAASYSFPGSVVPEVFRYRSWASTRLMTSEQRGELLKHVDKDDLSKKISYKECEKIAKDLNLTLEQVLSMYSSKRRHCLNQLKDEDSLDHLPRRKRVASHLKNRSSLESRPAKSARIDPAAEIVSTHIGEQDASDTASGDDATHSQEFQDDDQCEIEDSEANENENGDCYPLIRQCVLSKNKPTRQRRFVWSDETDRKLLIQYVKRRVALGAKYHRIDWASLADLPAPPGTCKKRMAFLNSNSRFRKSLMRLCNMVAECYAKHLEKAQNMSLNNGDCRQFVRSTSRKGVDVNVKHNAETQGTTTDEEAWDDFENESLKIALDEVLRCKKIAKMEASKKDFNENEVISPSIPCKIVQSHRRKHQEFSAHRSRRHRLDKKFTRFLNNAASVHRQVYESLAVSNAVELFKLVFLSTSTGPQAPNLLADILRRYSEHDLFAAFNYLREKKVMIGGNGNQPFELSQPFLNSVSKSLFPADTGKGAVKFSTWLHGKDKDLSEGGKNLPEDLQCGQIFHLFALVSSGELSISPCLPDNGVGEAEDLRNTKRKSNISESASGDKAKKLKFLEGEIISRREKGFPGIIISVHRSIIPTADTVDLFKENYCHNNDQHFVGNSELDRDQKYDDSDPDHMLEIFNSSDTVPIDKDYTESPWETMVGYARHLMSVPYDQEQYGAICAELFRVVYTAIQKAGDQGLSMEEVSQVINMQGIEVDGLIVDVLQAFGRALKVNAYDSVRVVDALYRHKYFLTSVSGFHQGVQLTSSTKTMVKSDDTCKLYQQEENNSSHANLPRERSGVDSVHKVTILNLPQENMDPEKQSIDKNNGGMQDKVVLSILERETLESCNSEMCVPILPWINGDGTINSIVYKGLRRRVLGIVMQNPGILEEDIILQMDALNPQSCKTLLELMVLDKHLLKRKMHQSTSDGAPSMLQNLIGRKLRQSKLTCREHFFANPTSTSLL
ncbi:hypothetical protein L6164_004219 [Bauhinia variegata]|uniref:Uncharacterized protein n=1 Tax=Bauhinia variegata TaxID=167791 RepID=A0ACB9Q5R2_BAUVA|nr:hypothetical protein L6164_004219 [Bauhinia variegata]